MTTTPSAPTDPKETSPTPLPAISLVIPTFNEAANIRELLSRIDSAFPDSRSLEILFVDDSTDNTPEVIEEAAREFELPVSVHHRTAPTGGLGGAVVEGIGLTEGTWIVVMDADLQHPPRLLPQLIATGERTGAELVVASRYASGGSRNGLADGYRRLVSSASTTLAKTLFPKALRGISDPMSGYFAIRRDIVAQGTTEPGVPTHPGSESAVPSETLSRTAGAAGALRPLGYKILLELAVRCRPRSVAELPYTFGERFAGESKSTVREGLRFLRHLVQLRTDNRTARFLGVGLVGLSGFLPNLAVLWLLTDSAGMHYAPSEIIANQFGLLWNFVLLDSLLYRRHRHFATPARLLFFAALGNADLLLRIPLIIVCVNWFGLTPVPATAISLAVVFALRFLALDRLLYRVGRGLAR